MEVVNAQDKEYYGGKRYNVSIGYGLRFGVYAASPDEALETLGKYCKDHDYTGLIEYKSYDELVEECDGNEDVVNEKYYPINGGEFYLHTTDLCLTEEEDGEEDEE